MQHQLQIVLTRLHIFSDFQTNSLEISSFNFSASCLASIVVVGSTEAVLDSNRSRLKMVVDVEVVVTSGSVTVMAGLKVAVSTAFAGSSDSTANTFSSSTAA